MQSFDALTEQIIRREENGNPDTQLGQVAVPDKSATASEQADEARQDNPEAAEEPQPEEKGNHKRIVQVEEVCFTVAEVATLTGRSKSAILNWMKESYTRSDRIYGPSKRLQWMLPWGQIFAIGPASECWFSNPVSFRTRVEDFVDERLERMQAAVDAGLPPYHTPRRRRAKLS